MEILVVYTIIIIFIFVVLVSLYDTRADSSLVIVIIKLTVRVFATICGVRHSDCSSSIWHLEAATWGVLTDLIRCFLGLVIIDSWVLVREFNSDWLVFSFLDVIGLDQTDFSILVSNFLTVSVCHIGSWARWSELCLFDWIFTSLIHCTVDSSRFDSGWVSRSSLIRFHWLSIPVKVYLFLLSVLVRLWCADIGLGSSPSDDLLATSDLLRMINVVNLLGTVSHLYRTLLVLLFWSRLDLCGPLLFQAYFLNSRSWQVLETHNSLLDGARGSLVLRCVHLWAIRLPSSIRCASLLLNHLNGTDILGNRNFVRWQFLERDGYTFLGLLSRLFCFLRWWCRHRFSLPLSTVFIRNWGCHDSPLGLFLSCSWWDDTGAVALLTFVRAIYLQA